MKLFNQESVLQQFRNFFRRCSGVTVVFHRMVCKALIQWPAACVKLRQVRALTDGPSLRGKRRQVTPKPENDTILMQQGVVFLTGHTAAAGGDDTAGALAKLSQHFGFLLAEGRLSLPGKKGRNITAETLDQFRVSIEKRAVQLLRQELPHGAFAAAGHADENEVLRLSGLSELIAARGEEYHCGENGSGLSGGEKQRISIARSLLRKTPVLLMDEATAALDTETAYNVTNSILDLDGLTRIVVTHSLDGTLLKRYDRILTLKNGSIIESGTFDELMEKKEYFYSLFTVSQK